MSILLPSYTEKSPASRRFWLRCRGLFKKIRRPRRCFSTNKLKYTIFANLIIVGIFCGNLWLKQSGPTTYDNHNFRIPSDLNVQQQQQTESVLPICRIKSNTNTTIADPETKFDVDKILNESTERKLKRKFGKLSVGFGTFDGQRPLLDNRNDGKCIPSQTVAIIIPFRDESEQLLWSFLNILWTVLTTTHSDVISYIVLLSEQSGKLLLNKGRLFNCAASYVAENYANVDCFIFHDLSMVPQSNSFVYRCQQVNGWSNQYWSDTHEGNEALAEDMRIRLREVGVRLHHQHSKNATFVRIAQPKWVDPELADMFSLQIKHFLGSAGNRMKGDGLNLNGTAWRILSTVFHKLFIHLLVNVGAPNDRYWYPAKDPPPVLPLKYWSRQDCIKFQR